MLPYINSLISRLSYYSKGLDQKSIFVEQPWVYIDENQNYHNHTFHSDGRMLMSKNGTAKYGTWEYLPIQKSLVIRRSADDIILLNQVFIDEGVMFLKKDGAVEEPFVLVNKSVIPDLDVEKYLKDCFIKAKNLRPLFTKDGGIYYAHSTYKDSQYTLKSKYKSTPGDEIYDKNLNIITNGALVCRDEILNIVDCKLQKSNYLKRYCAIDKSILMIKQSKIDSLSIGNDVTDDNGNPADGCYMFNPPILNGIKSVTVKNGKLMEYSQSKRLFYYILLTLLAVIIIVAVLLTMFK
jgi:hypothetical protein